MGYREAAGIALASALVTFDGTMAMVALTSIAGTFDAPMSSLQWITGAPLLAMAALLLPAGALGDRVGRRLLMLGGLWLFACGAGAAAVARGPEWLIGARFVQGFGAAAVLPGAIAIVRTRICEPRERTRMFGAWAAATGGAAALGPLIGGALVDVMTWRAVFALSATLVVPALLLSSGIPEDRDRAAPHPLAGLAGMLCLAPLLGTLAFRLIGGPIAGTVASVIAAAAVLGGTAGLMLLGRRSGNAVVPVEIWSSRNCVAANVATFLLYFGMFGFSFLIVIYTQVVLGYSAARAGAAVLPLALMLLLSERFNRAVSARYVHALLIGGPLAAGAGILWVASGPHPLPFWSHIWVGAALFGLGLAVTVSALTEAAVASVPEHCAGAASGFHHTMVRLAGLIAVAVVGSTAVGVDGSLISLEGFRLSIAACGVVAAAAGPVAAHLVIGGDLRSATGRSLPVP